MVQHRFILVTYPAQGHINPALQLSKRLITMGVHITLVTTLNMLHRITNIPSIQGLSFAAFSDGYDGGYNGTDFEFYMAELKRHGSKYLTNLMLSSTQQGHTFTCIVYTPLLQWAAGVAREFHIPTALLWIQPTTVFSLVYHFCHDYGDYINSQTKDPSCSIELPGLPLVLAPRDLPSYMLASDSSMYSSFISFFKEQLQELDKEANARVLVNTFQALEPEALRAFDKMNMIPIGPLNDPSDNSLGGDLFQPSNGYIEWLDSKPKLSVVYVSFGSFLVIPKKQMEEIARALLDYGHPFLWVIREKEKKGEELEKEKEREEEEEKLSCIEELEQKGKIVKWCSQVEVLSHPSLGCFLTHCGWNSTMESLASGVPLVAFPQWLDQKTNAKLIADVWKMGVRVDHEVNEEGVVKGEEITKCLAVVMGNGDEGEELRRNAKKWRDLAREAVKEGGSSYKNLRTFVDDVEQCLCMAEN